MYLDMCWPNLSHVIEDIKFKSICVALKLFYASENSKCISTCVDKTPPMPASKQNVTYHVLPTRTIKASQYVKTKSIPYQ
jgi:hypothetical protein